MNSTAQSTPPSTVRQPFPILTYLIIPDILLATVLALGCHTLHFPLRLLSYLSFAYICISGLSLTTWDKMQDYSMGSTLGGQFFTATHLLLLAEPIAQYRHRYDKPEDDPRDRPLWKRIFWAACVIHSPRGIGWNYQVSHIPPRPSPTPKWVFVCSRLLRAVKFFLLLDLNPTSTPNPLFTNPNLQSGENFPNVSIASQGWLWRMINGAAWMTTPYAGVSMQYYQIAAISVALGLSSPEDWSDPYGKWRDAYTVRNFWGTLSSYTQLYTGFFISALMHCFGDTMVGREYTGASFAFFISQAFAITFEDIIIHLASTSQSRRSCNLLGQILDRWSRVIGYIWVAFWLTVSIPWYVDWAVNAGLGKCELLPVSLVRVFIRAFGVNV